MTNDPPTPTVGSPPTPDDKPEFRSEDYILHPPAQRAYENKLGRLATRYYTVFQYVHHLRFEPYIEQFRAAMANDPRLERRPGKGHRAYRLREDVLSPTRETAHLRSRQKAKGGIPTPPEAPEKPPQATQEDQDADEPAGDISA